MNLDNHTPFPAMIFRAGIDAERLCAAVFARVTYDLVGHELVVASEQSWPVSPPPWESDYGPMDSDEVFYRGGVDLFVFASARPPRGTPATRVDILVEISSGFRRHLVVWGERYWIRQGQDLVPSGPVPFQEIPLTLENAYGGEDEWDELPIPYPDNPVGKGYYIDAESAEGKPLPNIEDPATLIRRWDDRPEPVGVGATTMAFGPRARRGAEFDDDTGVLKRIKPEFFNSAFPDLVVPEVLPGQAVRISGVHPDGPIGFVLPRPGLSTRLRFGEEVVDQELRIDQIGVEVDRGRVFISYRYPFRYRLIPLQERACELFFTGEA
jgi:hypothetical protein